MLLRWGHAHHDAFTRCYHTVPVQLQASRERATSSKTRASACCCMTSASNAVQHQTHVFGSCPLHTQQIRICLTHAVQRGSSSLTPSAYVYDHICAEHKPPEKGVTFNQKVQVTSILLHVTNHVLPCQTSAEQHAAVHSAALLPVYIAACAIASVAVHLLQRSQQHPRISNTCAWLCSLRSPAAAGTSPCGCCSNTST